MIAGLIRTMRPHQWVKNLFVVLPLVFGQELFHIMETTRSALAFILFCLASSAVYIGNDLADLDADRAHPIKQRRPIASGQVPEAAARRAMFVLAAIAAAGSLVLDWRFGCAVVTYLLLNVGYSLRLKRIPYVDVVCIALGFELRVLGGSFAIPVMPSVYLLLVTFSLALFLGFGKRRHELSQGDGAQEQRTVLRAYRTGAVDALLWVSAVTTVVVYAAYALDEVTQARFGTDHLAWTTAFTAFGVGRFLHLVKHSPEAESPTEEMLRDWAFLANLAAWCVVTLLMIYFGF